MSLFLLNLPSRILLRIIQKLPLVSFSRLRKTCRALNSFVDENADRIRIRSDHLLIISTDEEGNSLEYTAGIPANYLKAEEPLVQFQCTHFEKIFFTIRSSEHDILRREWNPRLDLQCSVLRVDFDNLNEQVWEIVGQNFKQYEKLCLNDCLPSFFVQISKVEISVQSKRIQYCTEIIADYSMHPLENVRLLKRFKSVIIDNYMFGKDDHQSFERCLRTLREEGSENLELLEIPNTNDGKLELKFSCLHISKLFVREVNFGELGNAFYLLEVGSDKYALIDVGHRSYLLSFVPKEIDQLVLVIYNRLQQNILRKKRIPFDFSDFYEKLAAAEGKDYCAIVTEFANWYFESVAIPWVYE